MRNGWLMGLVAVGVALTPVLVRGQNEPAPMAGPAHSGPAASAAASQGNEAVPSTAASPRREAAPPPSQWEPPQTKNPLEFGGLWFRPTLIRGQAADMGPPDPEIPLPLGKRHMEDGGLYLAAEFLFMEMTNPLHDEQIAVRGVLDVTGDITGRQGTFIGSRQAALRANDVGPGTYMPGFRVTGGWLFGDGIAVEVNWVHLFEAKYAATAGVEPAFGQTGLLLENTFLTSFVFNFPPDFAGPAQKVNIGPPGATFGIWDASSEQSIEFIQRFEQVELRARFPFMADDCQRTYWILGPRVIWLWERFKWRTVAFDVNTGQAGQDDVAIYSNIVSQRFYGVHLGCGYEWYKGTTPIGAFALGLELEAALFADIVKERAKYERGDFAIAAQRARTDYLISPELQGKLNLWWYPTAAIQMRIGYDLMTFFNTMSAPDPVSFNYGALDPPWVKGTFRMLEGISAGIAFSF
jgi:hypothetical protein